MTAPEGLEGIRWDAAAVTLRAAFYKLGLRGCDLDRADNLAEHFRDATQAEIAAAQWPLSERVERHAMQILDPQRNAGAPYLCERVAEVERRLADVQDAVFGHRPAPTAAPQQAPAERRTGEKLPEIVRAERRTGEEDFDVSLSRFANAHLDCCDAARGALDDDTCVAASRKAEGVRLAILARYREAVERVERAEGEQGYLREHSKAWFAAWEACIAAGMTFAPGNTGTKDVTGFIAALAAQRDTERENADEAQRGMTRLVGELTEERALVEQVRRERDEAIHAATKAMAGQEWLKNDLAAAMRERDEARAERDGMIASLPTEEEVDLLARLAGGERVEGWVPNWTGSARVPRTEDDAIYFYERRDNDTPSWSRAILIFTDSDPAPEEPKPDAAVIAAVVGATSAALDRIAPAVPAAGEPSEVEKRFVRDWYHENTGWEYERREHWRAETLHRLSEDARTYQPPRPPDGGGGEPMPVEEPGRLHDGVLALDRGAVDRVPGCAWSAPRRLRRGQGFRRVAGTLRGSRRVGCCQGRPMLTEAQRRVLEALVEAVDWVNPTSLITGDLSREQVGRALRSLRGLGLVEVRDPIRRGWPISYWRHTADGVHALAALSDSRGQADG